MFMDIVGVLYISDNVTRESLVIIMGLQAHIYTPTGNYNNNCKEHNSRQKRKNLVTKRNKRSTGLFHY